MRSGSAARSVFLAALILLFSGCSEQTAPEAAVPAPSEPDPTFLGVLDPGLPEPGGQAPDFLLKDLDHNPLRFSDFWGKPIVLNFFASWCMPCLAELPLIREAFLQQEERGYQVLGVAVQDSREAIRSLADGEGLDFPIFIDGDNSIGLAFHVVGPPYTFFIDATGKIVSVVAGMMEEETLEQQLAKLAGEAN